MRPRAAPLRRRPAGTGFALDMRRSVRPGSCGPASAGPRPTGRPQEARDQLGGPGSAHRDHLTRPSPAARMAPGDPPRPDPQLGVGPGPPLQHRASPPAGAARGRGHRPATGGGRTAPRAPRRDPAAAPPPPRLTAGSPPPDRSSLDGLAEPTSRAGRAGPRCGPRRTGRRCRTRLIPTLESASER